MCVTSSWVTDYRVHISEILSECSQFASTILNSFIKMMTLENAFNYFGEYLPIRDSVTTDIFNTKKWQSVTFSVFKAWGGFYLSDFLKTK